MRSNGGVVCRAWKGENVKSKTVKDVSPFLLCEGLCGEREGLIIYSRQCNLIPFVPPSHAIPDLSSSHCQ